ncbi:hypothetical protein ACRAR1_27745 [Streptomyces sanyensis]|uniref:hypothetical protein n=1 Tax=Streptomyces sanyensis TaxID=568869 RepID=UPI003D788B12
MDLHGVLDELYELAPQDFTEARNAAAAAAREAGHRDAADRIRTLRRPTLSAWAGNLLVRHDAEAVQAVLHLGEALREAHRTLDAVRLRELGSRRHQVVAALARRAADLAAERGHPLGDAALHEIEATVHVVLADPEAAREWADGHMARPLTEPVGFTAATVDLAAAPARRPPSGPPRAEDAGFRARRPGPAEPRETAAERAAGRPRAERRRRPCAPPAAAPVSSRPPPSRRSGPRRPSGTPRPARTPWPISWRVPGRP